MADNKPQLDDSLISYLKSLPPEQRDAAARLYPEAANLIAARPNLPDNNNTAGSLLGALRAQSPIYDNGTQLPDDVKSRVFDEPAKPANVVNASYKDVNDELDQDEPTPQPQQAAPTPQSQMPQQAPQQPQMPAPFDPRVASAAVEADAKNKLSAELTKAGMIAGAGFARTNPNAQALDAVGNGGNQNLAAVQALQGSENAGINNQLEQAKLKSVQSASDPKSQANQTFRDLVKRQFPDIAKSPQFDQLTMSSSPVLSKLMESNPEYKKMLLDLQQQRVDVANKNSDLRGQDIDRKSNESSQKQISKLAETLDPTKGRTGQFGQYQKNIDAADQILVLAQQQPDLNFDKRQMKEVALATARLLSGGSVAAQSTIKDLTPSSLRGDIGKVQEWLTNTPTGTEQRAFVKRMLETASREKQLNQGKIAVTQQQRLTQFNGLKDKSPEQYQNVVQSFQRQMPQDKPKQVIQNGHTYTLNPVTGDYE